jgi:hypothetical protein
MSQGEFEYLLIVRRECEEKFAFLQSSFARRDRVKVLLDRRAGERRRRQEPVGLDRRRTDRRGAPPPSWDLADYVLVPARTTRC